MYTLTYTDMFISSLFHFSTLLFKNIWKS